MATIKFDNILINLDNIITVERKDSEIKFSSTIGVVTVTYSEEPIAVDKMLQIERIMQER